MTRPWFHCYVVLAIAAGACGRSPQTAQTGTPDGPLEYVLALEALDLPAPPGSSQSQLTRSDRGAILSWLDQTETGVALKFSERTAAGWSEPQTVTLGDDWFLSGADVPSVLRMRNGALVAHWYPATDPLLEAYDIQLAYSTDDGRSWSAPFSPHHDGTTTQHGFASLFEMADGGLGLIWLDGRDMELNTTDPEGGTMAVYFASFDATWTQTAETLVDQRVCECCQTSVTVTDSGPLAAFRDRSPREIRDINVSRLDNGRWSPARPIHVDNFRVDACPINGPALSARGTEVAAAWFSAPGDDAHAFAAFSGDSGQTWTDPIRLDEEAALGHVDIELLDDGTAVASWMEFADGTRRFRTRRVSADSAPSEAVDVPGASRVNGYPHMTRAGDELLFAWTENAEGGEELKGAVARLAPTTP